ncbi:MerR family transcriptional regulator [Streptomyces sp. NPDC026659]|uniref:MerR family transcriptional regulator n=1 Tax=Streptomyces sp. NPDC026659 TaxID=3155123 RepID=UPI0033D7E5AC
MSGGKSGADDTATGADDTAVGPVGSVGPIGPAGAAGMRIGELARRAGTTVKAVRYYESLGLVTPSRRPNGYRSYDAADLRLVREIRALKRLGIPAERTRPFLDCLTAGRNHAECPASLAGYREAIDELAVRIEELTARKALLAARLEAAARPLPKETQAVNDDHLTLPADLPVPPDDGAADHLPGSRMPSLALPDTADGTVRLDGLGPGRTVIYVYPLTGRPGTDLPEGWNSIPGARGCTVESCGFRDHFEDLREAGAERVYGLSSQDTRYQREVVERLRLPFPMLSDPGFALAGALGLPTFEAAGTRLYKRLTLIVRAGVVEHAFYPVFPPGEHAGRVLEWLRERPVPVA